MNKKHNISSEESRLFRESVNKTLIIQEANKESVKNFGSSEESVGKEAGFKIN